MITLYDKPECPFCWKVRLALVEAGLAHRILDYQDPKYSEIWKRLATGNTVPVMVDDDVVIHESAVMLEYIQDAYFQTGRDRGLLPGGAHRRVVARLLASYSDNSVGKAVREVIFEKRGRAEQEWDWQRIERGTRDWHQVLLTLSEQLGHQHYFAGDYSLADMALTARFGLAHAYSLGIPEDMENLQAWFQRVISRPSFAATAPAVVLSQLSHIQTSLEGARCV